MWRNSSDTSQIPKRFMATMVLQLPVVGSDIMYIIHFSAYFAAFQGNPNLGSTRQNPRGKSINFDRSDWIDEMHMVTIKLKPEALADLSKYA